MWRRDIEKMSKILKECFVMLNINKKFLALQ